jgi:hypothetical protein
MSGSRTTYCTVLHISWHCLEYTYLTTFVEDTWSGAVKHIPNLVTLSCIYLPNNSCRIYCTWSGALKHIPNLVTLSWIYSPNNFCRRYLVSSSCSGRVIPAARKTQHSARITIFLFFCSFFSYNLLTVQYLGRVYDHRPLINTKDLWLF